MKYQVIVIGAGAGGLVVSIGAAKAGKKVLLIEKGHYGGDCTNFGCIPSKTLIACAEKAQKNSDALSTVRKIRERFRAHENPKALDKLGVHTLSGTASFVDPHHLHVSMPNGESSTVFGESIVIATGSSPFIPPIEGLAGAPFLTNETIFELETIPPSLGVLGAGPIGCELAQAFSRLGSRVTIVRSPRGLLPKEEREAAEVLGKIFEQEGIAVYERSDPTQISYHNNVFSFATKEALVEVDQLLIATGRRPNVADLSLEKADVQFSEKGIPIDRYGRTNQPHIFAIGDVVGGPLFTHLAENHGRTVLTTLLLPFGLKKKIDLQATPRCTFTDPEIASIGLSEKAAKEKGEKIAVYHVPFSEVDRAITTGHEEGFVKVVTKKWSSKILGATIVSPRAGEMLPELSLAMLKKIPLRKLARLIHPYPTYSGAIRQCADLWLSQTLLPAFQRGEKDA